ncbi:Sodium-dependent anion transporter family [hydrothermal vent metagenome]|uniref:Sodium-dependent anion transporter family n=1 Tax=hydrothermal vent metagenome TaxID=652676 RepID=A0A3B0QQV3_9ZZZZ
MKLSRQSRAAAEVITRGEETFEKWRKTIGLVIGPVVFLVIYFIDIPGLTPEAHSLFAVIGLVLVFWLTEAIPIPATALLGALLNVLLGVASAKVVLAPFANPLVFLFIGSFILAEAVTMHGLDRRFSFAILSVKFFSESPLRLLAAFGLISAVASMWISNTAATAMMLPIGIGLLSAIKKAGSDTGDAATGKAGGFNFDKYSTAMMLMIAYGASVGGIATPIGTPPNLIGIGMIGELIGVRISFLKWMTFALPITVVMFVFLFLLLGLFGIGRSHSLSGVGRYVREKRLSLGPWGRGEINTAFCFGVAVTLWLLPSIVGLVAGKGHALTLLLGARLNAGIVALLAAILLFILPVSFKERRFTMSWERAASIDWGTILLFGGGLSLGALMFSTGLAEAFGLALTGLTGANSLWSITALAIIFGIVLSETTSNTASANMVIPVVIAVAQGMGVSPMPPALGAVLGASFGFMLPVSTPPNAIVYGSGMVPILSMVRKGIIFDICGFFIILFSLMVLCPLFGWV